MSFLPQFLLQIPPNTQGLRDIKPPLDVPQHILPYILLSALILVAIVGITWVFLRKRHQTEVLLPPEEVIIQPPHEIALEQLAKLESESPDMETYHTIISNIIREYIAAQYQIPALELTTTALIQQMTREQFSDSCVKHIRHFLSNCDKVKFATYQAKQSEADERMVDAHWFIEETKAN